MSKLAIRGGTPVRKKPFAAWPVFGEEEERALRQVLRSGNWGGFPFPNRHAGSFGQKFAAMHGAKYGLAVANGTVAIEIALIAAGIQPGDQVIVPAYTWEGTAAPVLRLNAIPVFVDVDPETYCIDANKIEPVLTSRTRAILPVHLAMRFADMDAIMRIARAHKLRVIEDCAHAHGGRWRTKGAGSIGDAGAFSFQSSKLLTAGEGGAVLTNSLQIYERAQSYTNCGRASLTDRFRHRMVGFNYRMTEFQAAVLEVQLKRFEQQRKIRQANIERFERGIQAFPCVRLLRDDRRITAPTAYQYVFKFLPETAKGVNRAAFLGALEMEGVPCDGMFYEPVYRSPLFPADRAAFPMMGGGRDDPRAFRTEFHCPVAERAAYEESVWLPHHLFLGTPRDTQDIVAAVTKVCENLEELRGLRHPAIRLKLMNRVDRPRVERRQY
jgi:dTDP-4-amino-4,6-dideoxygalactose transaminase